MDEEQKKTSWRNWSDHPIIVAISVVGTLLTIVVTTWGLPKLLRGDETPTTYGSGPEVVHKSPKEIVDWFKTIKDERDAKRQVKLLYQGRLIRVSGRPQIFAAHNGWVQFKLPFFSGSIASSNLKGDGIADFRVGDFVCTIIDVKDSDVRGDDCRLED